MFFPMLTMPMLTVKSTNIEPNDHANRRTLLVLSSALLATGLFLICTISLRAGNMQTAPDAPGSVVGRLVDDQGQALAGIKVLLYGPLAYDRLVHTTESSADGTFQFDLLPAGIYKLEADPDNDLFTNVYFDGADSLVGATDVVVLGNEVDIGTFVLKRLGGISGRISARPGITYTLNSIEAYHCVESETEPPDCSTVQSTRRVDAEGAYTLTDLPADNYTVCVEFWIPGTYYNSKCGTDPISGSGVELSQLVTLTSGGHVTGVDFEIGANTDWGLVSGQVRDAAGEPIAGITVNERFRRGARVVTDANGNYTMTVVSTDTLRLFFADSKHNRYEDQYYGGTLSRDEATEITVAAGEHRRGIDATMQVGGSIQGTLMVTWGLPAESGDVWAVRQSESNEPTYTRHSEVISTTGLFELGGLPDGLYQLSAESTFNGIDMNIPIEKRRLITVTDAAVVTGVDLILTDDLFHGEVTGTIINQDGMPLRDIHVAVYRLFNRYTPLVYADTDVNGHYRITGLSHGSYRVKFSDPAGFYSTLYHPNQPTFEDAYRIPITPAGTTHEVNVTLAPVSMPTVLFLPVVTR